MEQLTLSKLDDIFQELKDMPGYDIVYGKNWDKKHSPRFQGPDSYADNPMSGIKNNSTIVHIYKWDGNNIIEINYNEVCDSIGEAIDRLDDMGFIMKIEIFSLKERKISQYSNSFLPNNYPHIINSIKIYINPKKENMPNFRKRIKDFFTFK